ncbi:MAG TPA: PAS domain S-box protein, partial [Bryobacteraceae bacterium]|nr:PAS domain S-box protein [Bryobacteraceae bacterium]
MSSETSRLRSNVENRDTARRYAVALLVFALGYLGRLALAHVLGFTIPYITFFPAIALSAWYGGFGPGVLITALSAASVIHLFLGSGRITTADLVGLILFLGVGTLISWLNHALRRSRRRAQNELVSRQLSEEALRESEELYRVMTDATVDAIITIDERSTILFANRGAERIFGHSVQQLNGKSLTMLMPESMRDLHRAGINRYLRTNQKHIAWAGAELVGLHKDGREIPLEISFGELRRGTQRLFTGVIRDI